MNVRLQGAFAATPGRKCKLAVAKGDVVMNGLIGKLAWAWVIIVGALMITPNGIECIACGRTITVAMGVISIALGAVSFVTNKQQVAVR
jgi:hypothetical protein